MLKIISLILLLLMSPPVFAEIRITQGETAVLNLTAESTSGTAFDLTGATFVTYVNGPRGAVNTFANSKHAIVSAAAGTYTLTLTTADTQALILGQDRELVTKVTQGSSVTVFRASILTVLPMNPIR